MNKHTPGPWQCYADEPSSEPNWHIVTNNNRQLVIANLHIEPGNARDAANAALITAAPDLLAALSYILAEVGAIGDARPRSGDSFLPAGLVDIAMQAVAKAEGAA